VLSNAASSLRAFDQRSKHHLRNASKPSEAKEALTSLSSPSLDENFAARVTDALRAGSRAALGEIYDHFATDIARSICRTTKRDESFALDCLQETFMKLASNPPRCETNAQLAAWLQVTALNTALNMFVAERRRNQRETSYAGNQLRTARAHEAPPADEILRALTQTLDDAERDLLRLRYATGLSLGAIAHSIGCHPSRIESALRRVVARLREGAANP
jgi:RNA polymerase sigma factor (sigma-70 family)